MNTPTNSPRTGEDAHTPTPWQFDTEPGFEQDSQTHTQAQIFGPKSNNAAPVVAFVVSRKEANANAALIVRAVNNHAALVAALEAVEQAQRDGFTYDTAFAKVRAALAAARNA